MFCWKCGKERESGRGPCASCGATLMESLMRGVESPFGAESLQLQVIDDGSKTTYKIAKNGREESFTSLDDIPEDMRSLFSEGLSSSPNISALTKRSLGNAFRMSSSNTIDVGTKKSAHTRVNPSASFTYQSRKENGLSQMLVYILIFFIFALIIYYYFFIP